MKFSIMHRPTTQMEWWAGTYLECADQERARLLAAIHRLFIFVFARLSVSNYNSVLLRNRSISGYLLNCSK